MHHYFLSAGKGIHLKNRHAIHHRRAQTHLLSSLTNPRHKGGSLRRDNEIDRLTHSIHNMSVSSHQPKKRNLKPIHFRL